MRHISHMLYKKYNINSWAYYVNNRIKTNPIQYFNYLLIYI